MRFDFCIWWFNWSSIISWNGWFNIWSAARLRSPSAPSMHPEHLTNTLVLTCLALTELIVVLHPFLTFPLPNFAILLNTTFHPCAQARNPCVVPAPTLIFKSNMRHCQNLSVLSPNSILDSFPSLHLSCLQYGLPQRLYCLILSDFSPWFWSHFLIHSLRWNYSNPPTM